MKKWRLGIAIVGALAVALGALNWLTQRPILIRSHEREVSGAPLLRQSGARVALVVDTSVIRASGAAQRFSMTDWSYGWSNVLIQEQPRYDILDATAICANGTITENYSVIIFTRSATAGMAKGLAHDPGDSYWRRLGDTMRAVVLELPPPSLGAMRILTDPEVRLDDGYVAFDSVTFFPPTIDSRTRSPRPFRLNSFGKRLYCDTTICQRLLEFDHSPVAIETRLGSARAIVTAFDFGRMAVTIQQGLPNDDFSVKHTVKKRSGALPLVTSDLCADSSYHEIFIPFFDLFERMFYRTIDTAHRLTPLFPEAPRGAFVMSHDEEGMGNRSTWMARQEKEWGVISSYLVIPTQMTTEGIATLIDCKTDIGLHTDKHSLFDTPGLPALRPTKYEVSIPDQLARLQALLPDNRSITINRNHWLLWTEDYTENFRKMAGAGIKMDLSYGPLGEDVVGYLFGTCFPFLPLDKNGFPLPILELPFIFQDDEKFEPAYIDSVFDTTSFNQEIVNFIFHVNTMGQWPDTSIMWGWQESFIRARRANLPIISYADVLEAVRKSDAPLPAPLSQ